MKKLIQVKDNNFDESKYQVCYCENVDDIDDIELEHINLENEGIDNDEPSVGCQTQ